MFKNYNRNFFEPDSSIEDLNYVKFINNGTCLFFYVKRIQFIDEEFVAYIFKLLRIKVDEEKFF